MQTQTSTRKGRPPAAAQTMPAFLKEATARVIRELPVSAATSRAIDEYIEWSSSKAQMQKQEALYRFVDHVLGDFMRRDGLFQGEKQRRAATAPAASEITDPLTAPATVVTPPATAPRPDKGGASAAAPSRSDGRGTSTAAAAGRVG